jgi:hypothetical protein
VPYISVLCHTDISHTQRVVTCGSCRHGKCHLDCLYQRGFEPDTSRMRTKRVTAELARLVWSMKLEWYSNSISQNGEHETLLFTTVSRPALGPTQPLIQWVPATLSLGVKRPGREADHSPQSSAEFKNVWSYTSIPPIRLHGVVLRRDNLAFIPFDLCSVTSVALHSGHFLN